MQNLWISNAPQYKSILNHLRQKHGLKLNCYFDQFIKEDFGEENRVNAVDMALEQKQKFQSWINQCRYKCEICGKADINSLQAFWHHIKKVHNVMEAAAYSKRYGQSMHHIVKHKCFLCERCVNLTSTSLGVHLKTCHRWEIEDSVSYYNRFIANKPNQEKVTFQTQKTVHDPSLLEAEKKSKKWSNGCIFKCLNCDLVSNGAKSMINHMRMHRKSVQTGQGFKVMKSVRHTCNICGKKVRHTDISLRFHLKNNHKLTVCEYFQKYVEEQANPMPT